MNTASAIELILSQGRKTSTYKLCVLRALVDLSIEAPGREPRNGLHFIPVVDLARRALAYYWHPSLLGIPQMVKCGAKSSIPAFVSKLAHSNVSVPGVHLPDYDAGAPLAEWITGAEVLPKPVVETVLAIRQKLIEQPLRYLPNLGDRRAEVFSVLTLPGAERQAPPLTAGHEAHLKRAARAAELRADTWLEILDRERTFVVLSARSYEEIAELRFWLRDAIVMRWVKECERFASRRPDSPEIPLRAFELAYPERDHNRVSELRALYEAIGLDRCLYTDQKLDSCWDLDHLLPFSRFPVNYFWNLVPATVQANRGTGGKYDRLPPLTDSLLQRYSDFLERCLTQGTPVVARDVDATYRQHLQMPAPEDWYQNRTVRILRSVMETSWSRLAAAGVEIWEPP